MAKELTHRADELKGLGWSSDDVSRYAELWDYRQRWGAINLERDDRQFLRKAEAALPKILSGKASTKKPINEKSYYKWLLFYLEAMNDLEKTSELPQGSRGLWAIIIEEELRVLDYYQPVLGLPDTIKAKGLDAVRESLVEKAITSETTNMHYIEFDFQAPLEALKKTQSTNWRSLREVIPVEQQTYPILSSDALQQFREEVRNELSNLIPDLFPSLSESDKPKLPNDWNRE